MRNLLWLLVALGAVFVGLAVGDRRPKVEFGSSRLEPKSEAELARAGSEMGRLAGGMPGKLGFMVSIWYNKHHRCSGVLISANLVLTAADCLIPESEPELYTTKLINGTEVEGKVFDYSMHPSVNLAMLRVEITHKINGSGLPPLDYVLGIQVAETVNQHTRLQLAGCAPLEKEDYARECLMAPTRMARNSACGLRDGDKSHICTENSELAICDGDVGGPLLAKTASKSWELAGIISRSVGVQQSCRRGKKAGKVIVVSVQAHLDWLMATRDELMDVKH